MIIGIVGAGKISEKHMFAYRTLGYDEIIIHDIDAEAADKVARQFHVGYAREFDDLMRSCDIVDVCTPVMTHKDIIIKALERGKNVFCEKPLCRNTSEAFAIREAARKAGKMVMVGYLYRFHPSFQQVKKWLDNNIIGRVHFGLFRIGGKGNHKRWKHMRESGGGCINEMLIHNLDLIHFFWGRVDSVRTLINDIILRRRVINKESFEPNAEDNILLELMVRDACIICQADFISPSYMEYFELHGEYGSIFASILEFLPTLLYLRRPSGIHRQGNNLFHFDQVNLFEIELKHFLMCVSRGESNMNSVEDSIELMKILEKINRRTN